MVFTRSSSHFDERMEEFKSYMANEHFLKTTTTHNNKRKREEYRVRSELHLQVMIDGKIIFQNGNLVKFPPTISSP